MNRKIAGIIVIALVVLGAIIIKNNEDKKDMASRPVVKIGIALPLAGNAAVLGEASKRASELALRDVGNTKYKYELVFEDQQFNPVVAASVANKLINVDKVLAILNFGSGTGGAISPITEKAKVVHFSTASDPTVAKGEYNYIHWTPPFKEGELLAKELVRRGYKKISIIDTNHPGTLAVSNAIKDSLKGSDVEISSYDLTNVGDKDFRTTINKLKKLNPDIIVLEMFSPEVEIMARQMNELGLKVPLTSVETFEWSDDTKLFEGDWFISDALTPGFTERYKFAYGLDPKPGSAYFYDLVTFLIKIQENSKEPIQAKDLPGIINKMGEYDSNVFGKIKIDKDGFFITEASVKIMKNGKAEFVN